MAIWYLRMEGVNQANFVFDTQDLSTIRGGALLLLDAVKRVEDHMKKALKPITTGASSGIFSFQATGDSEAEQVRKDVKTFLMADFQLRHATFVVDVWPAGNCETDFDPDREWLIAKNRWRQMAAPSLAVPSEAATPSVGSPPDDPACKVDMVRPAVEKEREGGRWVSRSVAVRRNYGVNQKQHFYTQQTDLTSLPDFAHDLDELTKAPEKDLLHHKMAVIYTDGNTFGKLQRNECKTESSQKKFDDTVKGYRKALLKKLLETIRKDKDWLYGQKLRLETLLWGGDEIIWVVPAWQGWWTMEFFFKESRDWSLTTTHGRTPLTHAAGLVFCHHNAPIYRIKQLARDLAGLAKEKAKHQTDKNLVAYQVLESFDHLGQDLERFLDRRCPKGIDLNGLILDGTRMGQVTTNMKTIKADLPKRQLHRIVQTMLDKGLSDATPLIKSLEESVGPGTTAALTSLEPAFGAGAVKWIHLLDLWDYIG